MSRKLHRPIPCAEIVSNAGLRGKIKSVYCKNFVTYGECTFYPTEYLNVIIGPNGTGKSTLVAAIVLGLGGKPELLSRSSSIGDYVKNGRDEAVIKVEIYRDTSAKSGIFERSFPRNGKSTYKIGESVVGEKKYLSEIMEFKIQIGNLCQFLPQDRVQDFAKMDPQTIFINTVNSVCSQETINTFDELKKLRQSQLTEGDGVKKKKEELEQLQVHCNTLEQRLDRYNEQQEYQNKLDVCEAKKLHLDARGLEEQKKQQVNDLSLAKQKLEEENKVYDAIMRRQSDIAKTSQQLARVVAQKKQEEETIASKKQNVEESIKNLKDRIEQARTIYLKKKRDKADYDKDLQEETKMLSLLLQDLTKANENNAEKDWKAELNALAQQLHNMKEELGQHMKMRLEINSELDEKYGPEIGSIKRRLERANDVHAQKLELLQAKFPDVYRAVQWLTDHQHLFRGTVYKPMILELSVLDPEHAKYFENVISIRDLLAFTCEDKDDVSLLVSELCVKQKLHINVGHAPASNRRNYRPDIPIESIRFCGFTAYLIDLIEGPPAIINYLCSLNRIHTIPIGTADVNNRTDDIPDNINIFFGGNQSYAVRVSRYSGEKSIMQRQISGRNLLTSKNTNEILQNEARLRELIRGSDVLKNKRTALEAKIEEIKIKREDILAKIRTIKSKLEERPKLEEQCRRQNDKVKQLKNNVISLPELEQEFTQKVKNCLQQIMQLQNEKIQILKKLQQILVDKKVAVVKERIFKQENEELINNIKEAKDNQVQAMRMVETVTRALEKTQQQLETKVAEARKAKKDCKSLELFNLLPDTMDELKEAINEYKARLECMGDVDQNIAAEFRQKCADIERLKNEMQNAEHNRHGLAAQINTLHERWYPEIENIVVTLNKHFSDFMTSMNYVGEVQLLRRDEHDYDTYGIQIMVQYRSNAQLQALDRHTQSGGERAVAIATYTLSLQHITHVPFRCVDEINQGMDANNERKIFEMLVKETTQVGRAQYFFVTPKLLPNLMYNERMSVHIVFNSKMVESKNTFAFQI
ncbi:PREDICTED: structural maintenance of chromosomes protein 5 [Bactrocera latifrons]|nr:PREDICTED: structural maintenance of chromosomes protein 5 [Bactrocera latifrons]